MKASIYNSYIALEGKHTLLFNALSRRFAVFKDQIINQENFLNFCDGIEKNSVKEKMTEGGMLIPENVDEIEIVRRRIEETDFNTKFFILNINPTLSCNFHCWYCYENKPESSVMAQPTIESVKKFISRQFEIYPEMKFFHLGFFGGEPMLHYHDVCAPLIEYTVAIAREHNVDYSITFTTNGFLIDSKIIEHLGKYHCSFQITLDGDRENHNRTRFTKENQGSYDRILDNVKRLIREEQTVTLRINYTSKNIESVHHIIDDISDIGDEGKYLGIDLQRVWQDRKKEYDDTEQEAHKIRDLLRAKGFMVMSNFLLRDVCQSCYGDKKNHILINYNGDVYGCTARDFNRENCIGKLQENGEIAFEDKKYRIRMTAKFSKEVCHTCRIAPLCGGGCRQQAVDHYPENDCYNKYSDDNKDRMIMEIFEHDYMQRKE